MKTMFVGATIKNEPDYDFLVKEISKIPWKKFAICYSNQFELVADKLSKLIDDKVTQKIQVLGCSNPKFKEETEAILIIGQGKFHAVSLAYESKLPTYVLEWDKIWKVPNEEILKMEQKEKGALKKYLMSDEIGILITTKPGQMRFKQALEFHKSLHEKKSYLFIANDINVNEFENFGIKSWVNTACPRMDLDKGFILNLDKIPKELIK